MYCPNYNGRYIYMSNYAPSKKNWFASKSPPPPPPSPKVKNGAWRRYTEQVLFKK